MSKKFLKWLTIGIAFIVIAAGVDYLIWRDQQIKRLEANSSLAITANGIIEYATVGKGPAVLVLHGTLGGYDQTQMLAEMLAPPSFQFIFVSRPGYLRTPLTTGATFAEQADVYASLLDELGIDQAGVMAISGGGPSALQFALRHPERCWGLVLIAANTDVNAGRIEATAADGNWQPPALLSKLVFSDFLSWMIVRSAQVLPGKFLIAMVGAEYAKEVQKDPQRVDFFNDFMNSLALLSSRRVGALNDGAQFINFTGHPFENITIPTLIFQGTEDTYLPSAEGVTLHDALPNSKYIEVEGGTHFMLLSHQDAILPVITDFLNRHAPAK